MFEKIVIFQAVNIVLLLINFLHRSRFIIELLRLVPAILGICIFYSTIKVPNELYLILKFSFLIPLFQLMNWSNENQKKYGIDCFINNTTLLLVIYTLVNNSFLAWILFYYYLIAILLIEEAKKKDSYWLAIIALIPVICALGYSLDKELFSYYILGFFCIILFKILYVLPLNILSMKPAKTSLRSFTIFILLQYSVFTGLLKFLEHLNISLINYQFHLIPSIIICASTLFWIARFYLVNDGIKIKLVSFYCIQVSSLAFCFAPLLIDNKLDLFALSFAILSCSFIAALRSFENNNVVDRWLLGLALCSMGALPTSSLLFTKVIMVINLSKSTSLWVLLPFVAVTLLSIPLLIKMREAVLEGALITRKRFLLWRLFTVVLFFVPSVYLFYSVDVFN